MLFRIIVMMALAVSAAVFTPLAANAAVGECIKKTAADCPAMMTVDRGVLAQIDAENADLNTANAELLQQNNKLQRDYDEAYPKARATEAASVIFVVLLSFLASAYAIMWRRNRALKRSVKSLDSFLTRILMPPPSS